MRLAELIDRSNLLKSKIFELERFIVKLVSKDKTEQDELSELRKLLDAFVNENQSLTMKISRANNQIEVILGTSKLRLSDALIMRDTALAKINTITDMIENSNGNLEVVSFLLERDKIYEEYFLIHRAIEMAHWSSEID
jgi:hypothetical protein